MVKELFEAQVVDPGRLRLVGDLDMETTSILDAAIETIPAGSRVTLDLSELSFIDSTGLHALARYAVASNGSGPLALVHVPQFALRVFEIVGLDKYEIHIS
jgi:anti-anti-sigma factor